MYVAKTAAILKAMVYLDHKSIEEVLEDHELSRSLAEELKSKLIAKLHNGNAPEEELHRLFNEIDESGSDNLSREEFKSFIEGLGIVFSNRNWIRIFREIDYDFDDQVGVTLPVIDLVMI